MVYALLILIILGFILNSLSKKYSLYKLTYKRSLSKSKVEIDEEFDITTIIENRNMLPVSFLQVIEKYPIEISYKFSEGLFYTKQNCFHKTTMFILPKQRIKRTYKVSFKKRGVYLLSNVTLVAGDFLGTETMSIEQIYDQEMVVYPSRFDIQNELKPFGSFYGDISVQRWIINDPILTIGVREYTGNEPQKSIHWPTSLRTGKLMVRNYDFTTDNKVMLVLNIECAKPFWSQIDSDKIEDCISLTRTIMEELEGLGVSYGLITNIQSNRLTNGRSYIPYGQGGAHFYDMLDFLGKIIYMLNCSYEELLYDCVNSHERAITYVLITPKILDEYIEPINRLSMNSEKTILLSMTDENLNKVKVNEIGYKGKES